MPRSKSTKAIKAGRASNWVVGIFFAALTAAAVVVARAYGKVNGHALDPKLITWVSAAVVLIGGAVATTRLSRALSHLATRGSPVAGGAVRVVSGGLGYLVVTFAFLAVLEVKIEQLLVGAGVVGVVLGIAAQQGLGNVFSGFVLLLARPFGVGDRIRIRSGALGGIFEGLVTEMSLTYVTLIVDGLPLKIPNSSILAAGVGQIPVVSSDGTGTGADGGASPGQPAQPGSPAPPGAPAQ